MPLASVVEAALESAQLAPDVGAVKVTVAPLTGLELPSRTVATSGAANAVFTAVLCGVPLVAEIEAGFGLELLQLVSKPKVRQTAAARMLE